MTGRNGSGAQSGAVAGGWAVVWGADDVAARLPHVALTVLEGIGHFPQVERPVVVAASVRALVPA